MSTIFFARRSKALILATASAFALCLAQDTRADIDWSTPSWGGYSSDFLTYDVNSRLQLQNTFNNHNRVFGNSSGRRSKKSGAKEQGKKNPKAYQYQYSQSVSQQTEEAFIANLLDHAKKTGTLDAAAEAKIRRMQSWNFIPTIRETLRKKGGSKDSVAQAMAFWLVINYGTIRKAQDMGVETGNLVNQLETVMSKDKNMLSMSDADKQRLAENLLWLALMQIVIQEEAGQDPAALQAAANQARSNLKSLGVDPEKMTIGKNGLALH
ncbi:DUF6683 family protein [Vandammella animalimorsus]|uniref:Uncharacterized protein n=1 Tax=Vandammella animalimorsus TaxID=2029117 RepID=A0A2A2ABT3_9BURK|nr:DUF6683 family protein [Vandammella animalimorsus]PAT35253.1 hypothetical protein CK620_05030 [Vandammella animalimorsus]